MVMVMLRWWRWLRCGLGLMWGGVMRVSHVYHESVQGCTYVLQLLQHTQYRFLESVIELSQGYY
jgi:hypothetical protein